MKSDAAWCFLGATTLLLPVGADGATEARADKSAERQRWRDVIAELKFVNQERRHLGESPRLVLAR
jgi:hypothetical protein